MKRFLTPLLAILFCAGSLVRADETKAVSAKPGDAKAGSMKTDMKAARIVTAKGKITKLDKDGKSMTLKSSKGREMTMSWDDSTKVDGDMKVGSMATVHYMTRDGKMMASDVKVSGAAKSAGKSVKKT